MTRLDEWLAPRLEAAPPSLRERIVEAVQREAGSGKGAGRPPLPASPFPFPEVLRNVAERLLTEAKSGPPIRDTALTLLAADALITFAMEAEFE